MITPKVSVLMPIYNTQEKHLKEAIESILNQSFTNFEFLILNDSPNSFYLDKIVFGFNDRRIKYFKNEKNLGISKTRNKLIEMAQGEYLAIADHDDISHSERFLEQVSYLDRHLEVGVCGCWFQWMHDQHITKLFQDSDAIEKHLMLGCAINHPGVMIRKSTLNNNNIRYENYFSPAEDYAMWCRLIGKTKFHNIQKVLLTYRKHKTQTSRTQKHKIKNATIAIKKFVRKMHPNIWKNVQNNIPAIIRVKLFGIIPLFTFRQVGCKRQGLLKFCPFLSIKPNIFLPQ